MCGEGCCFKSPFFRGPVGVGLFWLFLVHLIIITQMLFSLFSRRGGVLLSERVRVWIRNGCCLRSPFFWGSLFWLFLVHVIIIIQILFSLFSHRGGVLLCERVRVWIRNGCCFRSPFLGRVYFGFFWCI